MADILSNKIFPHLKEILPSESLNDFFGPDNLGVLFTANDYGYDFAEISGLNSLEIVNAFASSIGSSFSYNGELPNSDDFDNFEHYEEKKIQNIKDKLFRYKNVIITGCSGTGKSFIANKLMADKDFKSTAKMFWHSSTEYSDVIEGITAQAIDNEVKYDVLPGMVLQLAREETETPKLMVIEGINKSNAAENFGELITLLESDKRHLEVEGFDGKISIPEEMYFLCTMNQAVENQYRLDSAMKRRFVIVNLQPDYKLLALHFGIKEDHDIDTSHDYFHMSSDETKALAIKILRSINKAISRCVGSDYQIGHAVLWDLKPDCKLADVIQILDLIIVPQLEEYCYDEAIAKRVFGDSSPAVKVYPHGVELIPFGSLGPDELAVSIEEILGNE